MGIKKVSDIKKLNNDKVAFNSIVENVRGIGMKGLTKYIQNAMTALPSRCPPMMDHTKAVDPYVSRFGLEAEERIENSATCIHYTSINKLIDHMMTAKYECYLQAMMTRCTNDVAGTVAAAAPMPGPASRCLTKSTMMMPDEPPHY